MHNTDSDCCARFFTVNTRIDPHHSHVGTLHRQTSCAVADPRPPFQPITNPPCPHRHPLHLRGTSPLPPDTSGVVIPDELHTLQRHTTGLHAQQHDRRLLGQACVTDVFAEHTDVADDGERWCGVQCSGDDGMLLDGRVCSNTEHTPQEEDRSTEALQYLRTDYCCSIGIRSLRVTFQTYTVCLQGLRTVLVLPCSQ